MKVLYIPISICDLSKSNYPSAGPNANVTGMKNKFWGRDAAIVKQGAYIYKVPLSVYNDLHAKKLYK